MEEGNILFELKELYQWRCGPDTEESPQNESLFFAKLSKVLGFRKFLADESEDIREFYRSRLPWQFAVPDGNRSLLALLQENFLEIRHERDYYQKPVARTAVPVDENPTWRKLCWSSDGVLVALSTSDGELRCYNSLGSLVCSIPKSCESTSIFPFSAFCLVCLMEMRKKNSEWPYELLALDFCGNLNSYLISSTEGYKAYHAFSFGCRVTAAAYLSNYNTLAVAMSPSNARKQNVDNGTGVSVWRLVNEYPYYRLFQPQSTRATETTKGVVLKMTASSRGSYLACIYSCGSVLVYSLPALAIRQIWNSNDLRVCINGEEENVTVPSKKIGKFFSSDIGWCSDEKLTIVCRGDRLIVSDITGLKNLLTRANPSFGSVDYRSVRLIGRVELANVCDIDEGFILLNYKVEKSEIAGPNAENVANRNDSFYIHKIYNLIVLKKITAWHLYDRKINDGKFDEALEFARLFSLDENRVYKKQWRTSKFVTIEAIENCLLKITDVWWVIGECCSKIPETLSATEKLLDYGLRLTDFSSFLSIRRYAEPESNDSFLNFDRDFVFELRVDDKSPCFSSSQLRIILLRKHLLYYWDLLQIYKEIINLDSVNAEYNRKIYNKLRTESPTRIALYFARNGNTEAVAIVFSYFSEQLSSYWLEILNNIPECVPPNRFENLLPKFDSTNRLKEWERRRVRTADWSESGEFKNLIKRKPFDCESCLEVSSLDSRTVTEWYKNKIRRIVDLTGLVEYGMYVLNAALDNNIASAELNYLRHCLLVTDALVYGVVVNDEICLNEIETLTPFDQLKLLTLRTSSAKSFDDVASVVLAFFNRCKSLWPDLYDRLLAEFLTQLSRYNLNASLEFFAYVNSEHAEDVFLNEETMVELALSSIYACERVDQNDVIRKIMDYLPQCSSNRSNELQSELSVVEMLKYYGIKKNVRDIRKNKDNVEFQKATMLRMINAKITDSQLLSEEDVYELLKHLTFVRENFFNSLPSRTYLRMFAYTVLTTGRFNYIEDYAPMLLCDSPATELTESRNDPTYILSYEDSVAVIVDAAQYYVNSASSCSDPNISLARACLSLISHHPRVEQEKDLINALDELNSLEVEISPSEVRICENKLKLIELVLKTKPDAYKRADNLIALAKNLGIDLTDENSSIRTILNYAMNTAFEAKDYSRCSTMIFTWQNKERVFPDVCKKLCECREFDDLEVKFRLIKLLAASSPKEQIANTVRLRNFLERQLLRKLLRISVRTLRKSSDSHPPYFASDISSLPHIFSTTLSESLASLFSSSTVVGDLRREISNFTAKGDSYEKEFDVKKQFRTLTFPEFYDDVHARCNCRCRLNKAVEKLTKTRSLFRYLLLFREDLIYCGMANARIREVAVRLCAVYFSVDCVSSLCLWLLSRCDEEYDEKIFASLPKTIPAISFATYYYCLKFLIAIDSDEDRERALSESPSQLLRRTESSMKDIKSPFIRSVVNYEDLSNCGVDFERFITDETYKTDSILGLAAYEEYDKLKTALSLAAEYDVSDIDVIISHISSLFLSNNFEILTPRLKEKIVGDILKKNASYAAHRLHSNVYHALPGTDYRLLALYYSLLKQLAENETFHSLRPSEHIKLLKKVGTFLKIDYKILTTNPDDVLETLSQTIAVKDSDKLADELTHLLSNLSDDAEMRNIFGKLFKETSERGYETITNLSKNYCKRFAKISHLSQICQRYGLNNHYSRKLLDSLKLDSSSELKSVFLKITLDSSVSTDTIKMLADEIDPYWLSSVITDVLNQKLNQNETSVILRRIVDCLEANEYEMSWRDELQILLKRTDLAKTNRCRIMEILSILNQSDEEISRIVDLLHCSKLILRKWVSVHPKICLLNVVDENSRFYLLKELVKLSVTFLHFSYIYEILLLWPPFSTSFTELKDPYQLLLQKLLINNESHNFADDELELVKKITRQRKYARKTGR